MKLTASDLAKSINSLPKNRQYQYINPKNKGSIIIVGVTLPEGPIRIKRYNSHKQETPAEAPEELISSAMLWRVANAIQPNHPVNIDRIVGASYNTRSVLESLLAHTPQFYFCYPGRIEFINSASQIKQGHKHLIWLPDDPHAPGVAAKKNVEMVISEIPSHEAIYEALTLPADYSGEEIDINVKRRHSQIQVALCLIGRQLGFRTYVAANDQGIVYNNSPIINLPGVVASLSDEQIVSSYQDAINAGRLIDCVWFRNSRFMPAVIEVEHSTGVTSGLTRMKNFKDRIPPIQTRYVIAAADEEREKVLREIAKPQFADLNAKFFPYSAVEELYSLCQRRKIKGINDDFLDCFMESIGN